jgi:hypothetical protein
MNIPAGAGRAPSLVLAPVPAQPLLDGAGGTPGAGSRPEVDTQTPWADVGYVGWMNGTPRSKAPVFDTKFFTPEIRFDMNYVQSLNHPHDHTIVGSTEEFRSGEFQIEQVSFGGDFHWNNVRARFLSMFGMFATTTPRNDASSAVGQWDLQNAYRYFSEANAGYHFDVNHGLNVDLGVFVSYIGLFSYYNFDNWTYQPSFVSSNTPWFFNGLRVQWWPTQHLKNRALAHQWLAVVCEFNSKAGLRRSNLWIPNDSLKLVLQRYSIGQDNLNCQAAAPMASGNGRLDASPKMAAIQSSAGSMSGAGSPLTTRRSSASHGRQHCLQILRRARHGRCGPVESGVQLYDRHRLPVRGRHFVQQRTEQGQLFRHDALRPHLVSQ